MLPIILYCLVAIDVPTEGAAKFKPWVEIDKITDGIDKNGIENLSKAAMNNDVTAQASLGYAYYFARGVEKDYNSALFWFSAAAKNGSVLAASYLAGMYDQGLGVVKDYALALDWWLKAASGGDVSAQMLVAARYANGSYDVVKDLDKAEYWWGEAAKLGNTKAMLLLGKLGLTRGKDAVNGAIEMLRKAASAEFDARYWMAAIYLNGIYTTRDPIESYMWHLVMREIDNKTYPTISGLEEELTSEEKQVAIKRYKEWIVQRKSQESGSGN